MHRSEKNRQLRGQISCRSVRVLLRAGVRRSRRVGTRTDARHPQVSEVRAEGVCFLDRLCAFGAGVGGWVWFLSAPCSRHPPCTVCTLAVYPCGLTLPPARRTCAFILRVRAHFPYPLLLPLFSLGRQEKEQQTNTSFTNSGQRETKGSAR